jgi:hypothetical protein
LILFPTFNTIGIIVSFKINQNYIAKNLCEQRNVKNNCCHGCCQLKKRLAENDQKEQKQIPTNLNEKNIFSTYIFNEINKQIFSDIFNNINYNIYLLFIPNSYYIAIFHPPKTSGFSKAFVQII